ncbi:IS200/IS605 family transposase [Lewinella sp. 4G2]|uniref:IS200/IS605 family transposase n=1 Tax=Lewinella sp. 4G2 TaxID=1803372 RepID=UPI0007B4A4A3|nr:IS200/IS605 family transposase [Lewinella sp. 4G2]OAV44676.1 hypothetical protein A3850_009315 [Lewinella sp. 4G2]
MAQSFARVVLHTTFSTKYREKSISPLVEERLLKYMRKTLMNLGSDVIEINSALDHVHIVHTLPRTISISDLLRQLKGHSSAFLSKEFPDTHEEFAWQTGFATFSADYRFLDDLIAYVRNQKSHHRVRTFIEEYGKLLTNWGFTFNPKYVFPSRRTDHRA